MDTSLLSSPRSHRARRALPWALLPAALVGLALACGKTEPSSDDTDGGATDSSTDAGADGNADAGFKPTDAGFKPDPCPRKPSECIDDDTMRVYARDGYDAGICVWVELEVPCDDIGLTPKCLDGKCRVVVVR